MCTACGLPTTHTNTIQTISLASLLLSGVMTFLWVYLILSRAFLRKFIRKILDKIFPSQINPDLHQKPSSDTKNQQETTDVCSCTDKNH